MVGHVGQCSGNEICDQCNDQGIRDRRAQVDAVHWSGHCADSPWQEEVCRGRLPSWEDSYQRCFEEDLVARSNSCDTENALEGDEIEYPCDLYSPQEWQKENAFVWQPSRLSPKYDDLRVSETFLDEVALRLLYFDLSESKGEGRDRVHFVLLRHPEPLGSLAVSSIQPQAALATAACGDRGLMPADTIIEVDGKGGTALDLRNRIDEALLAGARVSLLVEPRPILNDIEVKRIGRFWSRLGVQVAIAGDREVRVSHVRDRGLIPEWNASHDPAQQVLVGDCILCVNGISDAKDIYESLHMPAMGETLHIRFATSSRHPVVHREICRSPAEGSTTSGGSSSPISRTSSFG